MVAKEIKKLDDAYAFINEANKMFADLEKFDKELEKLLNKETEKNDRRKRVRNKV